MEPAVYPAVCHQPSDDGHLLRLRAHPPHLLPGKRYHRLQNRHCAHRYVGDHRAVPPLCRVPFGQFQPLPGFCAVSAAVLPTLFRICLPAHLWRFGADPAVHGSGVLGLRFGHHDPGRGRAASKQGGTGNQPLCPDHLLRNGRRTFCRNPGAKSSGKPGPPF